MPSSLPSSLTIDEARLGADFIIDDQDLVVDTLADWPIQQGIVNVLNQLATELTTPYGLMARFSWHRDAVEVIDASYGLYAHRRLSEPIRGSLLEDIKEDIIEVVSHHSRIRLEDIQYEVVNGTPLTLIYTLSVDIQNSLFNILLVSTPERLAITRIEAAS